jgi:phage head maturation protease
MTTIPTTLTTDVIGGGEVFAVDREARTIRGRAMPYGVVGVKAGQRFQFDKGAITYGESRRVKIYVHHDKLHAVGFAAELVDTDEGLDYVAKIARGPLGDEALTMAEDGVWDGASVGPHEGVKFALRDGVYHAVHYPLREISLTPQPVFDDARVTAVSMSHHTKEGTTMPEENPTPEGVTFDASTVTEAVTAAIRDGFANMTFPQREVVGDPSGGGASFEVNEPSPYRFDGIAGAHSFSDDLRSYASGHDADARQRIDAFMVEAWEAQFAVTSANVGSLNPTRNRPDLFVPNLTYTRPLWDLVTNGVVDDKTPFTIPKFSSASGMVQAHTEGVEPTPGAFTATSQTITPSPMSGKVEIVREVWDQGGEPKADAIIWGEMMNGYFEAIEAGIATNLASVATAEINLASAVDAALVDNLTGVLVDLQFVRGGNRYTALALDGLLGKALVNAKDTSGRKLLPVLGPTNANGTTEPGFDGVQLGNLRGRFAWALGATNASKSYLFVPSSVYAWASAPRKFTFEYRVSAVDLAIWGYRANAVTRDSDVKPIDYTTADV